MLYLAIALFIIYHFYKTIVIYRRGMKRSNKMHKAAYLNGQVKVGDYIHFQGSFSLPETQTPFNKVNCVYWGVVVRAVFTTKMKKPGKGMQTHSPVIFKDNNDHLPLLISDGKQVVQLGFANNIEALVNLNSTTTISNEPPSDAVKALAKPKYQHYSIEEKWADKTTRINVWGTVNSVNKNCVTLTANKKDKSGFMVFYGDSSLLLETLVKKRRDTILLFTWLIIMSAVAAALLPVLPNLVVQIISAVVMAGFTLYLKHRLTSDPFKQES